MEINLGNSSSYIAFISYKHDEVSIKEAKAIQKFLETFKVPKDYSSRRTLGSVFRDKDELAVSHDLNETIKNALDHSEFLIVVCSKLTKQSEWVKKEIAHFLEKHGEEKIIYLVAEGNPEEVIPDLALEIQSDDTSKEEGINFSDKDQDNRIQSYRHEPLAACIGEGDNRTKNKKRKEEYLRIAAAILGCTYDNLYQRAKRRQFKQLTIYSACILSVLLVFGAIYFNQKYQTEMEILNHRISSSYNLVLEAEDLFSKGYRSEALKKTIEGLDQYETGTGLQMLTEVTGAYDPDQLKIENVLSVNGDIKSISMSSEGNIFVITYVQSENEGWDLSKYYLTSFTPQGSVRWKIDLETISENYGIPYDDELLYYCDKWNTLTVISYEEIFILNGDNGHPIWKSERGVVPLGVNQSENQIVFLNEEYDEFSEHNNAIFMSVVELDNANNGIQIKIDEFQLPEELQTFRFYTSLVAWDFSNYFISWNDSHSKLMLVTIETNTPEDPLNIENLVFTDNSLLPDEEYFKLAKPWVLNLTTGIWQSADRVVMFDSVGAMDGGFNDKDELWLISNYQEFTTHKTIAWFYDESLSFQSKDEIVTLIEDLDVLSVVWQETYTAKLKGDILFAFSKKLVYIDTYKKELVQIIQFDSYLQGLSLYADYGRDPDEKAPGFAGSVYVLEQNGNLTRVEFGGSRNLMAKPLNSVFSTHASVKLAKTGDIGSKFLTVFSILQSENTDYSNVCLVDNLNNELFNIDYSVDTVFYNSYIPLPFSEYITIYSKRDEKNGVLIINATSKEEVTFIPFEEVGKGDFTITDWHPVIVPGKTKIIFQEYEDYLVVYDWVHKTVDRYEEGLKSAYSSISDSKVYYRIDKSSSKLIWIDSRDPLSTNTTSLPFLPATDDDDLIYLYLDDNHNFLLDSYRNGTWVFSSNQNEWIMIESRSIPLIDYKYMGDFSLNDSHLLVAGYESLDDQHRSGFYLLSKDRGGWKKEYFYPQYESAHLDPDNEFFLLFTAEGKMDIYDPKSGQLLQSLTIEGCDEPVIWKDPVTGYLIIRPDSDRADHTGYVIDPKSWEIVQKIPQFAGWSLTNRGFWIYCDGSFSFPIEFHEFIVGDDLREYARMKWDETIFDQPLPEYLS